MRGVRLRFEGIRVVLQRGRENSFVDERLYTELPVGAMEVVLRDAAEPSLPPKRSGSRNSPGGPAARLAAFAEGAAAPAAGRGAPALPGRGRGRGRSGSQRRGWAAARRERGSRREGAPQRTSKPLSSGRSSVLSTLGAPPRPHPQTVLIGLDAPTGRTGRFG